MYNITMPQGGQTTDESVIVKWHKQIGDKVERGDILFEMETDKATMEVESYCSGYLNEVLYGAGEKASAGEIVAYIGAQDEAEDEYQPIIRGDDKVREDSVEVAIRDKKILVSPRAKQAARQQQLNISEIPARSGMIKWEDVKEYIGRAASNAFGYHTIPTSKMRKIIAGRMYDSVHTAPHYTVSMDVDMAACIALRQQLNTYLGNTAKIAFHDIIGKCVAKAVQKYPNINSMYAEDEIKIWQHVNIGLAVGIENGLVVPVVKSVDEKTLTEIAKENGVNIKKAQEGKLTAEELTGGTITISNLGMYGVKNFTAIINQPESCILAIGAIIEQAVSVNHEIVTKDIMTITGSFDHRVIDGAVGAKFLKEVQVLLEHPELLLA